MALPCLFNWREIYCEQLHSFDGARATIIEVVGNQRESLDFCAEEIAKRGLNASVRYFPIPDADSERAAKQFKDGEVSFCFIDGPHTYHDTLKNLRAWGPKVHFNSAMAGHGIRNSEVRRAVEDFCKESPVPLPWRIINECFQINHMHRPGQVV
jgi:hypothetical protein